MAVTYEQLREWVLALLDSAAGLSEGDVIEIDIRGRRTQARIVKPPFVETSVR